MTSDVRQGSVAMRTAFDLASRVTRAQVHRLAYRTTRSGDFGIRGYWPDTNQFPLFEVHGGWVGAEDLLWLRDQIDRVLGDE